VKKIDFIDWGLIDYATAWQAQKDYAEKMLADKAIHGTLKSLPHAVFFCEHPAVYTLGKSGKPAHLLHQPDEVQFFQTDRGGDITCHSPGQVVMYPVLDLSCFFTDLHKYLRTLEQVVIDTLSDYSVQAERYPNYTGVWLDAQAENARKICAMGVKCSRWVVWHGLALNANNDLRYFDHLIPCAIKDKGVTSLALELQKPVDLQALKSTLQKYFLLHFQGN
jgi:lipoyl(octanoyl) transferase